MNKITQAPSINFLVSNNMTILNLSTNDTLLRRTADVAIALNYIMQLTDLSLDEDDLLTNQPGRIEFNVPYHSEACAFYDLVDTITAAVGVTPDECQNTVTTRMSWALSETRNIRLCQRTSENNPRISLVDNGF